MGEAREFGFESVEIYSHVAMFNCKQMEEVLQKDYDHLSFPLEILWSRAGNGSNYIDRFNPAHHPCKVYLTFSKQLQPAIASGRLVLCDKEKQFEFYGKKGGIARVMTKKATTTDIRRFFPKQQQQT